MTKRRVPSKKKVRAGKRASEVDVQKSEVPANIDPEQRRCMIAETAYLIAEQRNFQGDALLEDWLRAEAEVDSRLAAGTQLSGQD